MFTSQSSVKSLWFLALIMHVGVAHGTRFSSTQALDVGVFQKHRALETSKQGQNLDEGASTSNTSKGLLSPAEQNLQGFPWDECNVILRGGSATFSITNGVSDDAVTVETYNRGDSLQLVPYWTETIGGWAKRPWRSVKNPGKRTETRLSKTLGCATSTCVVRAKGGKAGWSEPKDMSSDDSATVSFTYPSTLDKPVANLIVHKRDGVKRSNPQPKRPKGNVIWIHNDNAGTKMTAETYDTNDHVKWVSAQTESIMPGTTKCLRCATSACFVRAKDPYMKASIVVPNGGGAYWSNGMLIVHTAASIAEFRREHPHRYS